MIVRHLKRASLRLLDNAATGRLLAKVASSRCVILMLHRFTSPNGTSAGHDPARLHSLLDYFYRTGIKCAALDEVVEPLANGDYSVLQHGPKVIFTVDDGYSDFLEVGMPVFGHFDCPVTSFIVPSVIDQQTWFWWDQIDWIQRNTTHSSVTINLGDRSLRIECADAVARKRTYAELCERIRSISNAQLVAVVNQLSAAAEVSIPDRAPDEYRVATWDELRSAESRGARFGAHSMTHPILSRCDDDQATHEIIGSVQRVRSELKRPSSVFCYPVGCPISFGEREISIVKRAGMLGALSTSPGTLTQRSVGTADVNWLWRLPRMGYEERQGAMARIALL
jgi:peptidoglycan/xylan/chitin deacetylase (PgdA/CDA1 family)